MLRELPEPLSDGYVTGIITGKENPELDVDLKTTGYERRVVDAEVTSRAVLIGGRRAVTAM